MAELLASLGHIAQQPLADEQLAELESLHREAQPGTTDRLKIGTALAQTYWAYSRFDRAIDLLSESLDEYQAACGGVLPASANDALGTLISYSARPRAIRPRREDPSVADSSTRPISSRPHWLVQRLYQLYDNAISQRRRRVAGTRRRSFIGPSRRSCGRTSTRPIRTTATTWSFG